MANDSNVTKEKKPSKLTTTHKILIFGFAFLIIVIGVAGYFIYQSLQKPEEPTGNSYLIDESNLTDITRQMAEEVADGMFEVNMNTKWTFPDGKSASTNAEIANSSFNKYPIAFDIRLAGEEEPIFTSTVIPVGSQINKVILERSLSAGTYDAVCTYHLLDDNGNEKSTLAVNITLTIQK